VRAGNANRRLSFSDTFHAKALYNDDQWVRQGDCCVRLTRNCASEMRWHFKPSGAIVA
jgi:hypothetical protein